MSRIRRLLKKICALMMVMVILASSTGVTPVLAETGTEADDYLEGLFERYENYRDGAYGYYGLTNDSAYRASLWAGAIEQATTEEDLLTGYSGNALENFAEFSNRLDRNFSAEAKSALLWAGRHLTNTSLNEEAYVEYLSKIVAMHEQSFMETAATQAEYAIRVNAGDEWGNIIKEGLSLIMKEVGNIDFSVGSLDASKITKITLKDFVDEDTRKILSEVTEGLDLAYDFGKTVVSIEDLSQSLTEVYVLAMGISQQCEQIKFLNAIYENADEKENKKLKKAAKSLLDASCMELGSLMYAETLDEFVSFFSATFSTVEKAGEVNFWKCMEILLTYKGEKAAQLITGIGAKFGVVSGSTAGAAAESAAIAANSAVKVLSTAAAAAGYFGFGLAIGSFVGRLLMGNQYEMAREILIMDEISGVLSEAIPKYNQDYETAKASGDDAARYKAVYNLVAAAEALCYTRLAGEYAVCEYAKGTSGAPSDEELDLKYQEISNWMNDYYLSLSTVFPESGEQVTVYANYQYSSEAYGEDTLYTEMAVPVVTIEGNEAAAEKINADQGIQEYHDEFWASGLAACSGDDLTEKLYEWLWLEDAAVTGQGLSMMLHSKYVNYSAGGPGSENAICRTYDLKSGEVLKLNDILAEGENGNTGNAREALAEVLAEQFSVSEAGQTSLEYLGLIYENISAEEIIREEFLEAEEDMRERHWYLNEDGLNIMFDKYQIASGADGVLQFTVPWEQLTDIIKSEYQPEEVATQTWGIPELCRVDDTSEIEVDEASMNLYGTESKSFWIGYTKETAYEVKIMEGRGYMVFYANVMTPNDVVCLQDAAGFDTDPYLGGTVSCLTANGVRHYFEFGNAQ